MSMSLVKRGLAWYATAYPPITTALTFRAVKHANSSSKSFNGLSAHSQPLQAQRLDGLDALVWRQAGPELPIGGAAGVMNLVQMSRSLSSFLFIARCAEGAESESGASVGGSYEAGHLPPSPLTRLRRPGKAAPTTTEDCASVARGTSL
jgi:hypothetical protein